MEIVNLCCTSLLYDFQDIEQGFLQGGDIVNLFCSSLLVNLSRPTHLNVSKTFPPHPKRTKQGRTFGALLARENGSRSSTLAVRTPCFLTGRKQNIPEYSRYAPILYGIFTYLDPPMGAKWIGVGVPLSATPKRVQVTPPQHLEGAGNQPFM